MTLETSTTAAPTNTTNTDQKQAHPEDFNSETSGNANIDRYIDESIRAQDEGKTPEQTNTPAKGSDSGTASDTTKSKEERPTAQPEGSRGEDTTAQPNKQGQDNRSALPEGYTTDAAGNIRKTDGSLVASAGEARRWWERFENVSKSNKHAQAYIKRLEADLEAAAGVKDTANYLNGVPAQLGLQHNEVATGLNIIAAWKKNPHEAIKFLLTEYAAMGHNVNELLGKEGGIDLSAVQTMINRAVQPIVGTHQQQQEQQQALVQAERQYNAFMAKYPDAAVHENEIAALMARDKSLTADSAFHMLKAWALEQRLDFTKPLGPQFQAAPQSVQGHNQPPHQGSNQQPMNNVPPLPNGRGTSEAALNAHQGAARADEDWDSIIRGEMKRSGYNA